VTGESKRDAVQSWQQGADLPIARVADMAQATVFIESGLMS